MHRHTMLPLHYVPLQHLLRCRDIFAERLQMSLAQADGAEVAGAGAGGQEGPAGGVPRPELAAVAHRTKRRAESELLR